MIRFEKEKKISCLKSSTWLTAHIAIHQKGSPYLVFWDFRALKVKNHFLHHHCAGSAAEKEMLRKSSIKKKAFFEKWGFQTFISSAMSKNLSKRMKRMGSKIGKDHKTHSRWSTHQNHEKVKIDIFFCDFHVVRPFNPFNLPFMGN